MPRYNIVFAITNELLADGVRPWRGAMACGAAVQITGPLSRPWRLRPAGHGVGVCDANLLGEPLSDLTPLELGAAQHGGRGAGRRRRR